MKAVSDHRAALAEELVRQHQDSVRGFLLFVGCSPSRVDDLVQDTFLSLLCARFEDRGRAATAAYLRKVARNLFLKSLRKERRRPVIVDLDGAESAWTDFEADDQGESYMGALRQCLTKVDERGREVLGLRYSANLRRAAIAERLGLSESGVKSVLVRTRKRLRACIERRLGR